MRNLIVMCVWFGTAGVGLSQEANPVAPSYHPQPYGTAAGA